MWIPLDIVLTIAIAIYQFMYYRDQKKQEEIKKEEEAAAEQEAIQYSAEKLNPIKKSKTSIEPKPDKGLSLMVDGVALNVDTNSLLKSRSKEDALAREKLDNMKYSPYKGLNKETKKDDTFQLKPISPCLGFAAFLDP